jgi:NSS family neurotransmitter:Na+ symporter
LPLGGILICLFVGWVYGLPQLEKQLSNNGKLHNQALIRIVYFLVRYLTPLSIAVVLLHGLKVF